MSCPRSLLTVLALWLLACGADDPAVRSAEYAFKHGPGPGPPYSYVLTTFSGEGMACGGYADGKWYYSTGEWMFRVNGASGCGTKLKLMANNKCVVVEVADNGPADWVEANAQAKCGGTGYILDVSPVVSQHLFGVSSSGWSDCRFVQAWVLPATTPNGPISCSGTVPTSWIGDPCAQDAECTTSQCLTAYPPGGPAFQDGMCTQPCTSLCPDSPGEPTTFCITFDPASGSYSGSQGHCFSQCDTTLFPGSGCRPGYSCAKVARHNDPGTIKDVCLPLQSPAPDAGTPTPPPPPADAGPQPPPPPPADSATPPTRSDGAAPPPAPAADGGQLPPAANPPPTSPAGVRGADGCTMGPGPGSRTAGLWLLGLCLALLRGLIRIR